MREDLAAWADKPSVEDGPAFARGARWAAGIVAALPERAASPEGPLDLGPWCRGGTDVAGCDDENCMGHGTPDRPDLRAALERFHDNEWHPGCTGRCDAMRMARAALRATDVELSRLSPEPVASSGLDAAWAEAEAALPEGWDGPRVGPLWVVDDHRTFASHRVEGSYVARATTPDGAAYDQGEGDSPAAALRALAEKLRGEAHRGR